jgi:hypothetical protein
MTRKQDWRVTRAEALAAYYSANAGNGFRPGTLPEASAGRFACHDVCHVIFGLDTMLSDDAMADPRTILSCNDGVKRKRCSKRSAIAKLSGLRFSKYALNHCPDFSIPTCPSSAIWRPLATR